MPKIKRLLYIGETTKFFTFKSVYHAKLHTDGNGWIKDNNDRSLSPNGHFVTAEWLESNFIEYESLINLFEADALEGIV